MDITEYAIVKPKRVTRIIEEVEDKKNKGREKCVRDDCDNERGLKVNV